MSGKNKIIFLHGHFAVRLQFNFSQSKKMKVKRETAYFLKRLRSEYVDLYKSHLLFTVLSILIFKEQELRKYYVRMFSIFQNENLGCCTFKAQ